MKNNKTMIKLLSILFCFTMITVISIGNNKFNSRG
jgi:hypothetical protein